jgi:drug/metabolite transporter (DMT)-like permease
MNIPTAILIKLLSVVLFAVMSALVRDLGGRFPLGQVVFFRSLFAILPVLVICAFHRQLVAAVRTARPFGHLGRGLISIAGMFLTFASLARLPLMDATAISFAAPLIMVALAALILHERVRIYRWTAVGVGFAGVIVMLWPDLDLARLVQLGEVERSIGAACALGGALCNAGTVIQTRRLTNSETTYSIVFYFSLICAIAGAATLPFAWVTPSPVECLLLALVGIIGGLSHVLLTESYRYAPASVVAPFDYTAMVWAFLIGYFVFGEVPSRYVYIGSAIVVIAGLFVIWREHRVGVERPRPSAIEGAPVGE